MKKIGIILSLTFILFLVSACDAGLFNREKQVRDEYLEKLFTPDFPYEYVKVMEDSTGRRFIVIRAKEDVGKLLRQYDDLLLSRGVNIYGAFHYGDIFGFEQKTVTNYSITITRKAEGEPDTIEISQSVVKDPVKDEPIVAATARGKKIRIAIEPDLGKTWKKIKLIPDNEPEAPEPKVGRYPGSKLVKVKTWPDGDRDYVFVSKASFKQIYDYYSEKLQEKYPFADEMFSNPKAYSHNSIKLLDIKTTGREFRLYFVEKDSKGVVTGRGIDVFGWQSTDPNLSGFVQIDIMEK